MTGWVSKLTSFSAGVGIAILAVTSPQLRDVAILNLDSLHRNIQSYWPRSNLASPAGGKGNGTRAPFECVVQPYRTHIVSTDPLVIYIHDFISKREIDGLLEEADGLFKPSMTTKRGRTTKDTARTSWSAGLPVDVDVVRCVLDRANDFMGTMLSPGKDEMGSPQLVRYKPKQKFDLHFDWYPVPQRVYPAEDRDRKWNRPASFFAILEDDCTEGETYFPHLRAVSPQHRAEPDRFPWREHEKGGLAFRPVAGNALFWVNLFANGTGDERTRHAGLPVKEGSKTAMNIWPKQYVGPEAWDPEPEAVDGGDAKE
ncbi:hypothetical protein jhhlp_001880 [Lomentospora prolificans]|uniref:Prolyl 4-hydroxylase alpha subunit domain-containing protein n=1 Tax=Lomentospora prolificans TaxID=41688 RepID=A0A2N3NCG8_9PEZI|nr:hypothetical protein jhhlp_001880 [Lomentospora prolificans]